MTTLVVFELGRWLQPARFATKRRLGGPGQLAHVGGDHGVSDMAVVAQSCPLVHGRPHTPQTWRRGQCLTVRGLSNSLLGRNGIRNIRIQAGQANLLKSTAARHGRR
jgi:hypothetical protein